MNRLIIVIFLSFILTGCAEKIRGYLDDPGTLLQDPYFMEYQQGLDNLESQYLRKEITYAEYLERKNRIDEKYAKDVLERQNVVEDTNNKPGEPTEKSDQLTPAQQ